MVGTNRRATSMKEKLIKMQLSLAVLILVACSAAFIVNDLFIFKHSVERNLESIARILNRNLTPALAFSDQAEAGKVLSSLQAEPSVTSAYVFDENAKLFSQYGDKAFDNNWRLANTDSYLSGTHLIFRHTIDDGIGVKGSLYLDADLAVFAKAYKSYLWIVLIVFITGVVISYLVANLIQRTLSGPFSAFARTAKTVSETGNYSIRMQNNGAGDSIEEIRTLSTEFNRMLDQIQAKDEKIVSANSELEKKVEERTAKLEEVQKAALASAHAAGMAEIATGILHNIGNITNSVNTSADELLQIVNTSKVGNLLKANQLLQDNMDRVGEFLSTDPKGKILPEYFIKIGNSLAEEQRRLKDEVGGITKKITLIKDVIHTQQEYARKGLFVEKLSLVEITEEILAMQQGALTRHEIELCRIYGKVSDVKVQKVKFAHILMNLFKNAKEAMAETPDDRRKLTVEIGQDSQGKTFLKISDTGEGVSPNNLQKIFSHGFTTKVGGHGFGLHFCANAMTEMGGEMTVESAGPGKGTSFILTFAHEEQQREVKYA